MNRLTMLALKVLTPSSSSMSISRVIVFIAVASSLAWVFIFQGRISISSTMSNNSDSGSSTFSLLRGGIGSEPRSELEPGGGAKDADIWVRPDTQHFNEQNIVHSAQHLIMVAGHSVTISGHLQDAGTDEKDWYLLDYQKGRGLPQAILAHIRKGIELAALDEKSLLVFSGGETRSSTGPVNEGSSYFRVADAMHLWDEHEREHGSHGSSTVRARTTAEEFATDSFQNL